MGNSSNSYATLAPRQGNAGDLIDAQQQQDNINKQQWAQEAKYKNEREDKSIAELEASIRAVKTPLTNYSSHDEATIDIINRKGGIIDQLTETHEALKKDRKNVKLITKKINLEKGIEGIANAQKGLLERTTALDKGLAEGTFSPELNKTLKNDYNSIVKDIKYNYIINENGTLSATTGNGNFDRDGDGMPDTFNLGDVYDDSKLGSFKLLFKDNEWLTTAKARYGSAEKVRDGVTDYIKETTKGFDPNKTADLENEIKGLFGGDLTTMTDEGKSYLADIRKIDYTKITDEDFTKYKDEFKKRLINSYDSTDKKEKDSGDENADLSRQQSERHFQQKVKEEGNVDESTPFTRHIAKTQLNKGKDLKGKDVIIAEGSGFVILTPKGNKAMDGSIQIWQEAYQEPNGTIKYGIRQKDLTKGTIKPEVKKDRDKKKDENPKVVLPDLTYEDFNYPERVNYFNSTTESDKISTAIVRTIIPGSNPPRYFKSTIEADNWVRNNTNPQKSGGGTTTNTPKKKTPISTSN